MKLDNYYIMDTVQDTVLGLGRGLCSLLPESQKALRRVFKLCPEVQVFR